MRGKLLAASRRNLSGAGADLLALEGADLFELLASLLFPWGD